MRTRSVITSPWTAATTITSPMTAMTKAMKPSEGLPARASALASYPDKKRGGRNRVGGNAPNMTVK